MRKRTYKCTRKICEGAELSVTIEITLNDFTTVKEAEAKLKEMFAEEWSCPLHEIKLKLLSKSGKKRTNSEILEDWLNGRIF